MGLLHVVKNPKAHQLRVLVLISAHLQLVLGLVLYFTGPLGFRLFAQEGVMKEAGLRFYAVEHIATMVIAIVLITLANRGMKRAAPGLAPSGAWLYLGAWVLILSRIPWERFPFVG
ncbi:hypothetical protein GC167_08600 [bacterium]|nr:hypothetical protein [bacterium]